jgi:uncharacterized protein (DUF2141 family)
MNHSLKLKIPPLLWLAIGCALLKFTPVPVPSVAVAIVFTDIKTSNGLLQFGIYKNEEDFKAEKPFKLIKVAKTKLQNGKVETLIQLPPGLYGVSVLDDENTNGKMDYNFVGMPKEGFAFSNYYHSGLSRPVFNQFKFEVRSEPLHLVCKFRYL